MSRLMALVLVAAVGSQAGCAGGLSENNRKGMLYGGGAAVFMGGVIAIDGATCDPSAGAEAGCDEDDHDLLAGLSVMGVGLLVGGLSYLLRAPKHAEVEKPATGDAVAAE